MEPVQLEGPSLAQFLVLTDGELEAELERKARELHRRLDMLDAEHGFGGMVVGESFTGGKVHDKLIDNPGSSHYLVGGIIFYNPFLKMGIGVPEDIVVNDIVSADCAVAAARCMIGHSQDVWQIDPHPHLALTSTGWAGPGEGAGEYFIGGLCYLDPRSGRNLDADIEDPLVAYIHRRLEAPVSPSGEIGDRAFRNRVRRLGTLDAYHLAEWLLTKASWPHP